MGQNLPHYRILTIAGSDSGGGAGIQADLKTFAALGAYGASVITAITAQNTQGVQAVHVVPPEMVVAQARSILQDMRIDAVKIGMLPDVATIEAVAMVLREYSIAKVVLDPVLVATSGDQLALEDTVGVMRRQLFALAGVVTPNLNELAALSGAEQIAGNDDVMIEQGEVLLSAGAQAVLLKGGHGADEQTACDWLIRPQAIPQAFASPRINTQNTHGTGCTLSSAIAALWAQDDDLVGAIGRAKAYLDGALAQGQYWRLGQGHGPLAHFWTFFDETAS